jgi:ectoine hydroxylase-related dioxygenase (phytanoyl-CoA dioxygenase family)
MQQIPDTLSAVDTASVRKSLSARPANVITEQDIESYHRDGVVCLRGMFDPNWCALLESAAREIMASGAGRSRDVKLGPGQGRFYSNVYLADQDWRFGLLRDASPAAEIAATLMQANVIRYYYDQLFIKTPSTIAPTPWHNDLPFWPFQGNDLISIWIALTPVSKETSGVQYIAGSHRWGTMYRAVTPDFDPRFIDDKMPVCPNYGDAPGELADQLRSWTMNPGDVLCHHPLTVHGAAGNQSSTQTRIGLSIRFLGQDVRWDPRPHTMTLRHDPGVPPGAFPADDIALPIVWDRATGLKACRN